MYVTCNFLLNLTNVILNNLNSLLFYGLNISDFWHVVITQNIFWEYLAREWEKNQRTQSPNMLFELLNVISFETFKQPDSSSMHGFYKCNTSKEKKKQILIYSKETLHSALTGYFWFIFLFPFIFSRVKRNARMIQVNKNIYIRVQM